MAAVSPATAPISSEAQALERGEAILIAKFGRTVVDEERPLTAHLDSGVWTVSGSLPKNRLGGVGTVQFSAEDGRVIRVLHPL